jgi:energy-converting hydrogenase A subunit R
VTRVFISDCEGPISKNDNAYEMTSHFVPDGGKLFTVISRYDDVLAGVLKRPHYKAGDTLKLILPFLKAYDVTDEKMRQFSARNLLLIPNVKDTLQHVRSIAPAFIVSTSYEHYIQALCKATGFPYENTYSTKLNLDRYHVANERSRLREIAREIVRMPTIEIPHRAKSLDDLSEEDQKVIRRLDAIFWEEMSATECGKIFAEVNPVGGEEKAEVIKHVVQELDTTLSDIMYVGDSITDEEAFKLVKKNDGLTLSFNGNQYAVKNAEIAVLSENSTVTAVISDLFIRFGKQQALDLVEGWSFETLKKSKVDRALLERLFRLFVPELPKVKIITSENMEILARESSEFRGRVRGKSIGSLG